MSANLLVLGIDALDPVYFDHHRHLLPNLDALSKRGVSGRLRSTIPPVTGPAWTSAFSGMNPAKTGVTAFTQGRKDGRANVLDSRDVMVPRIWNVLSAQGKRCAVIGVPMAYPVERINGMMVGGFMTPSTDAPFTYPSDLQPQLLAQGYEPSLGWHTDAGQRSYLRLLHHTARIKYDLTLRWLQEEFWDCFVVVLSEPDWIQHYLDRPAGHPEHQANERRLLEFFQMVDDYVGRWANAAGTSATTIICSDHGFGHFAHHQVHLNRFLTDEGYLRIKSDVSYAVRGTFAARFRELSRFPGWSFLRRQLPHAVRTSLFGLTVSDGSEVDWNRTLAHFRQSYGICGAVRLNRGAFPDAAAFHCFKTALFRQLRELEDPSQGCKIFREVHLRERLFSGPYLHREPDIICLLADGYFGSDMVGHSLIVDIPMAGVPGGTHRQDGTWIMAGPKVAAGLKLNRHLQDIAPMIYHLLDVRAPEGMDGQVCYPAFEAGSAPRQRPLLTADYSHLERRFVLPSSQVDATADELVAERLRQLGYIE